MKKSHQILAGIAALQLILLVGITIKGQPEAAVPSAPLTTLTAEEITAFVIKRADDYPPNQVPLNLVKKNGVWVVPTADDYQVDSDKVENVLEKLVSIDADQSVARSKTSHNALKVGDRDYTKRVQLTAGTKTTEIVIGEGKGRSMYVRKSDADDVYLVRGLTAYDVSHEVTNYTEAEYFKMSDLQEVRVNVSSPGGSQSAHLFQDATGKWEVDGLGDAPIDESRVRALLIAVRSGRMVRPVGKTIRPEFGLGNPRARVTMKNKDEEMELLVGSDIGDFTYVKVNTKPDVILVRKYTLDALLRFNKEQLIDRSQMGSGAETQPSNPSSFVNPTR